MNVFSSGMLLIIFIHIYPKKGMYILQTMYCFLNLFFKQINVYINLRDFTLGFIPKYRILLRIVIFTKMYLRSSLI